MCMRMLDVNLCVALLRGVIVFTNFVFPSGPFPSVLLNGNHDTRGNNKYYIPTEVKVGRFLSPKHGLIQTLHLRIWACLTRSTRFLFLIIEKCSTNMPVP